jgi:transcriptional regulator with XRE-family HTH domain
MQPMNRIAQARMDAGFSVKEMAEKLGVDKGTLSNWESGKRPLTLERLLKVAKLLGVGAAYLLWEDERIPLSTQLDTALLPTFIELLSGCGAGDGHL